MIAKILGKLWRIERVATAGAWGECDDPGAKRKAIRIDPGIEGEKLLEIILHESLHAAGWPLDEAFVTDYAKDAARLAVKLGFRQVKG